MGHSALADAVVVLHLVFIVFAVLGGLAVLRRPWLAWLHIPAVLWAGWVELAGWICPLTPLENWLRAAGGTAAYTTGFVEHYLVPMVYPAVLTRPLQMVLGISVLVLNLVVYAFVWRRRSH